MRNGSPLSKKPSLAGGFLDAGPASWTKAWVHCVWARPQHERARVTLVPVFGSMYQGAILDQGLCWISLWFHLWFHLLVQATQ